jgi:hypothetical protein
MVSRRTYSNLPKRGALVMELVVAMAILAIAVVPLAFSFVHERQLLRRAYTNAVAMEIVDGEMEVLAAGEWQAYPKGTHPYSVKALAATNLPRSVFELTITNKRVRLEWIPQQHHVGGRIVREAQVE